jgi:hypothetical protein
MGENRPRNVRMFGSQRHGGNIHVPALLEASHPLALGISPSIDKAKVSASSVYQKGSQVTVTLVIRPSRSLPPLECCRGVIPSQAAKLRPFLNTWGSPTLATSAVAVCGPMASICIWVNLAFYRRRLHLPLRALPSLPRTEVQSR